MTSSETGRSSAQDITLMKTAKFDALVSTIEDSDDSPELEKLSARPRLIDR